jgi:excisionase family DNA binding protein
MRTTQTTPNPTIIDQLRSRTSLLTGTEVMALLQISRNGLCQWCREGRIPYLRIGKDNRFDPLALAAWLEQRRVS